MIDREAQAIGERALADAGRAFDGVKKDLERLATLVEPDPMTVTIKLEWRQHPTEPSAILRFGENKYGTVFKQRTDIGWRAVHWCTPVKFSDHPTEAEARGALLSAVRAALQGDAT